MSNAAKESRSRVAQAYTSFNPDDLTIRDLLALDRTVLANERTFLSYVRTAVVICACGFTLIKLFPQSQLFMPMGYILICIAPITIYIGYKRYLRTKRALQSLPEELQRGQ